MNVLLYLLLSVIAVVVRGQRPKLNPDPIDRHSNTLPGANKETCTVDDFPLAKHEMEEGGLDPNLVPFEYTKYNSDGSQSKGMTLVYKRSHISEYYNSTDLDMTPKDVQFEGFGVKFINMAPYKVQTWWEGYGQAHRQGSIDAFQATGTCSFQNHKFIFTKYGDTDASKPLKVFHMEKGQVIYVFDPVEEGLMTIKDYSRADKEKYYGQLTNVEFGKRYKEFTGADWLGMFPKSRPHHKMWRADSFGQVHTVYTNETQFMFWPPEKIMSPTLKYMTKSPEYVHEEQIKPNHAYRQGGELQLNLKVLSVAPRVFEIEDFLSDVEVDHILELGQVMDLGESSTGQGGDKISKSDSRTSRNTWVDRETSPIIDAIYRRAADLLRIDEAEFRWRHEEEDHISRKLSTRHTIAESLQLVHYDVRQQYTAHHDFGYTALSFEPYQNARFATLLFYLNEGMTGGETTFPRWMSADTGKKLTVTPKRGKAVLFYSVLPDGNFDDLSQHAAEAIRTGEKWLTNLWVHDPFKDKIE